jgi:hypothetical protein
MSNDTAFIFRGKSYSKNRPLVRREVGSNEFTETNNSYRQWKSMMDVFTLYRKLCQGTAMHYQYQPKTIWRVTCLTRFCRDIWWEGTITQRTFPCTRTKSRVKSDTAKALIAKEEMRPKDSDENATNIWSYTRSYIYFEATENENDHKKKVRNM